MSIETLRLIEAARLYRFTSAEKEEHRRSFAYGNTKIENARITRELINQEAEELAKQPHMQDQLSGEYRERG